MTFPKKTLAFFTGPGMVGNETPKQMNSISKNLARLGKLALKDMRKNKPARMTPDQAFHHGVESAAEKDGFSRAAFFSQPENRKAYKAGYASIDPSFCAFYR